MRTPWLGNGDSIIDAINGKTRWEKPDGGACDRFHSSGILLMTRIHSYVVRYDSGFGAQPFYGYCTLATCKPSIRRGAGHR